MALKNLLKKLNAPTDEVGEEQRDEAAVVREGVSTIGDARPRQPIVVVGEIVSVRIVPKAEGSPWLEATVSDGTGKLIALWTGRRRIAGVVPGQRIMIKGRPAPSGPGGRLLIYNPIYELL